MEKMPHPYRPRSRNPAQVTPQPKHRIEWETLSPIDVLTRNPPGRLPPLKVLEILLRYYNTRHTALEKIVSHKTRHDRAQFLRRAFRDLHTRGGFKTLPDPRNLGQRHVQALVRIWQEDGLAAPTIQTYMSFLRGLASWVGKPGMIRDPGHYGLSIEQYRRQTHAERDHSWSAQSVDVDALVERVYRFDPYVGASLRLIQAFGLRRKEAVMFRPQQNVVPFGTTGLPPEQQEAERYIHIRQGAKGGRERFIPLSTPARLTALAHAQEVVDTRDAHMGRPDHDLKRNLRHFDYVLKKFGITAKALGITAHGLRHEVLIDYYQALTGTPPPVRGGGAVLPEQVDQHAREAVARLAGHARTRVASAYLGQPAPPILPTHDKSQASPATAP